MKTSVKILMTLLVIVLLFGGLHLYPVEGQYYKLSSLSTQPSNAVPYMNLRSVSYKLPVGPDSTVNAQDGATGPNVYIGATTLHNLGINEIRADGMSWTQYDNLGIRGWQNAINYEAAAFDAQGISIVWGLPILDDVRHVPCDLLFYALSSTPTSAQVPAAAICGFGGSGSNPTSKSAAVSLFDSNAIYWGKTTNTEYTAANGTVIPAGTFSWPWASQYAGLPVWQAYSVMLKNTVSDLQSHTSTFALKIMNEPFNNGWNYTELLSYNSYIGQQLRADGWTGYIVYSDYTVRPGVADIEAMAPKSTGGEYLTPLMFEFHYPTTTDLSNVQTAASQVSGLKGWDGEDWITYLNGQNGAQPTAQQQAGYGVTVNAFGFDINCDGRDLSTSCRPLTTGTDGNIPQLISALNAAYGTPQFFTVSSTTSSTTSTSTFSPTSSTTSTSKTSTVSPTTGTRTGSTTTTTSVGTTQTTSTSNASSSSGTETRPISEWFVFGAVVVVTLILAYLLFVIFKRRQ